MTKYRNDAILKDTYLHTGTIHSKPMKEIKPIYLQDLVSLAKMLPKINFLDHESEIIRRYSIGQWVEVDKYVMFVYELHERLAKIRHTAVIADRRATFTDSVVQCVTKVKQELVGLHLWLQRNFWISIKPAKDCLFSRRLGYTGKIIYGYSIQFTFNGKQYPNKEKHGNI